MQPNFPVWFGQAVHKGLEIANRGADWELGFMRAWRAGHRELAEAYAANNFEGDELPERTTFTGRGLEMIKATLDLGLEGEPEWGFNETLPALGLPVKGFVDLVDRKNHRIYDYKTANRVWSQQKADDKVWQPSLYSLVYHKLYKTWPTFAYIILPVWGPVQAVVLERAIDQAEATRHLGRAQEILDAIERDEFPCTCPKKRQLVAA
jgi:hypothetical protein